MSNFFNLQVFVKSNHNAVLLRFISNFISIFISRTTAVKYKLTSGFPSTRKQSSISFCIYLASQVCEIPTSSICMSLLRSPIDSSQVFHQ